MCKRCFNYKSNQRFHANCKGEKENENGHDNENYCLNVTKWKTKEFFLSSSGNFVAKMLKPTK